MSEAQELVARARERAAAREQSRPRIDYDALNRTVRRQRAALTRAINSGEPEKVILAAREAVRQWNQPGAIWPDDWSRWQRAVDDVLPLAGHIDIGDLA
jgi:thioesterase domain-containing protein